MRLALTPEWWPFIKEKMKYLCLLLLLWGSASAQPLLPQLLQAEGKSSLPTEKPFDRTQLFNEAKTRVFQVRSINQATGQKAGIGSGFVVGDGHLMATNYHVIAPVATRAGFQADYLNHEQKSHELKLIAVDVINDLALLQSAEKLGEPLPFAKQNIQGEALFALGNPQNLGLVMDEGSNNGYQQNTAVPRILFSGALNAGMSGGPTLNANGEVVGVNVATQGNGLGFIVPVEKLEALLKQPKSDLNQAIAQQLNEANEDYFQPLLTGQFKRAQIGGFDVPTEIGDDIRCWDTSEEPEAEDLLNEESLFCTNNRVIYISDKLQLGQFGYAFSFISAQEALSPFHFYHLYSQYYDVNYPKRSTKDYGDIKPCHSDFLRLNSEKNNGEALFKTTYCARPSIKYPDVSDIYFIAGQIGKDNQGLMIKIVISGIKEELGQKIIRRILKEVQPL